MAASPAESLAAARPPGRKAAQQATARNSLQVSVPGVGVVKLPPPDQLAFVAGIAALTALEIIEWPVGLALACGHLLAGSKHNKIVRDFGEALEDV
jgi:hypothetical protein